MMDLGDDDESAGPAAPPPQMQFQQQQQQPHRVEGGQHRGENQGGGTKRPRVCFPDHPGPVLPLLPPQAFDAPIVPAMGGCKTSIEVLNKVHQFQSSQRVNLEKLRLVQWQILSRPSPEGMSALLGQESLMERDTRNALQALVYLWCNFALVPMEIWRWEFLWLDLHIQLEQIVLYLNEVRNEGGARCAIVIITHPFPVVATRGRTLDGPALVVQLLTGAAVDLLGADPIRAEAVIPKGTKSKLPADLMDHATSQLQPETRHAEFRLKFANGTRKQPVQFQFRVGVTLRRHGGGEERAEVASAVTPPTISVTNEVQWEEAEGMLMERVAFQFAAQCSWMTLCNHLQRHLIYATRQNVCQLVRIFSLAELSYFHRTFFGGSAMVNPVQFQEFWKWYGKAAHKIRYSKHVLALYLSGLLFGYIAKQEMEVALAGRPPGTFMIRFSERNAGSFSIAYVTQDTSGPSAAPMVRHYLVSAEDITQRKSLADFIGDSPALTHFLRLIPRSGFSLVPSPLGLHVQYELAEKHQALQEYYAKRDPVVHTSGYDRQLNPQPPSHVFQSELRHEAGSADNDGRPLLSGFGLGSAAGAVSPTLSGLGTFTRSDADYLADSCWDAE